MNNHKPGDAGEQSIKVAKWQTKFSHVAGQTLKQKRGSLSQRSRLPIASQPANTCVRGRRRRGPRSPCAIRFAASLALEEPYIFRGYVLESSPSAKSVSTKIPIGWRTGCCCCYVRVDSMTRNRSLKLGLNLHGINP